MKKTGIAETDGSISPPVTHHCRMYQLIRIDAESIHSCREPDLAQRHGDLGIKAYEGREGGREGYSVKHLASNRWNSDSDRPLSPSSLTGFRNWGMTPPVDGIAAFRVLFCNMFHF